MTIIIYEQWNYEKVLLMGIIDKCVIPKKFYTNPMGIKHFRNVK